jgi:hypothetical protein
LAGNVEAADTRNQLKMALIEKEGFSLPSILMEVSKAKSPARRTPGSLNIVEICTTDDSEISSTHQRFLFTQRIY